MMDSVWMQLRPKHMYAMHVARISYIDLYHYLNKVIPMHRECCIYVNSFVFPTSTYISSTNAYWPPQLGKYTNTKNKMPPTGNR